eukprot:5217432-Karenia_brevis.AAC.1
MAAQLHQNLVAYFSQSTNQTVGEASISALLGTLQTWQPGRFTGVLQPAQPQVAQDAAENAPQPGTAAAAAWEHA